MSVLIFRQMADTLHCVLNWQFWDWTATFQKRSPAGMLAAGLLLFSRRLPPQSAQAARDDTRSVESADAAGSVHGPEDPSKKLVTPKAHAPLRVRRRAFLRQASVHVQRSPTADPA